MVRRVALHHPPALPLPDLPAFVPVADSTPAPQLGRPSLRGRFVALAPLAPEHAGELFAATHGDAARERAWLYLPRGPFPDAAAFAAHVAACAASADPAFLALLDPATGRVLGHASYLRIDPANRSVEVGHVLFTPALQRTRAATEAMLLMADHAFGLGYRRYEWKCNALNAPSRAAAARLGFTHEGTFRQHMIVKERNRDTCWFSILDGEWPARRRAMTRWLDAANFDVAGRQRVALSLLNAPALDAGGVPLRRASLADRAALEAMQGAAWAANAARLGVTPAPLRWDYGAVLRDWEAWLAEDEVGLLGALLLNEEAGVLAIESVAVAPRAQRQRLGDRLLAAGEARGRALGLARARLSTGERLTDNVAWYGRRGYAVDRVEDKGDRRVMHMSKAIDGAAA